MHVCMSMHDSKNACELFVIKSFTYKNHERMHFSTQKKDDDGYNDGRSTTTRTTNSNDYVDDESNGLLKPPKRMLPCLSVVRLKLDGVR